MQEKEELEEAFETFKQEVTHTREGNASKEIRILKKVIKNLEARPCCDRYSYEELSRCVCIRTSLVPSLSGSFSPVNPMSTSLLSVSAGGHHEGEIKASEICQQKERRDQNFLTRGEGNPRFEAVVKSRCMYMRSE